MGDLGTSLIRTFVPLAAGYVISLLVLAGVDIGSDGKVALTSFLTALFTGLYYALFRFLEVHFGSQWGWLLGLAKSATYQ